MSDFFTISTYTPWDGLISNQLTQVKLLSLKSVFKSFPVIQKEFFEDLTSNIYNSPNFSFLETIKRVTGPNNEDYDIANWNFLWAMDSDRRIYQFLFQKVKKQENSDAILVAMAPPELAKLFQQYQKEAVLKTLSLLNNHEKIKFVMVLAPKGKSLAQEFQPLQISKDRIQKLNMINKMANMPNISGDWFPSHSPKCPICNAVLIGLTDYRVGFGQLICPQCGYKKV